MNVESASLKSLLRTRQQIQSRKSCFPCRERKVRCNRGHPCITCSRRGHPDLCQYPNKSQQQSSQGEHDRAVFPIEPTQRGTLVRLNRDQTTDSQSDSVLDSTSLHNPVETQSRLSLLGRGSILAISHQNSIEQRYSSDRQRAFENGILPLLGINSGISKTAVETFDDYPGNSLPVDEELVKLFEFYRDRAYPFQFVIVDLRRIEEVICTILASRIACSSENHACLSEEKQFLALIHAILACGAQFSDLPADRRLALSKKHANHAFEILRVTNYLSKPCKEGLQTLLLLGNVLQNDMNPQAAWILGGTTIRIAISLGIHNPRPKLESVITFEEAKQLRQAIVWQDALLSLAFDRPPSSQEMSLESDLPPLLLPDGNAKLGYREAMIWLSHLIIRHSSLRMGNPSISQFMSLFKDMELLEECRAHHLQNRGSCSAIKEIGQHYCFELHKNFVLSTLCRSIASKKAMLCMREADAARVMAVFQSSLKKSARSFIQLHSTSSYTRRSWALVHNGLASALLLSLMADTRHTDETRDIQKRLIKCLTDGQTNRTGISEWGDPTHLSNPHKQCLIALQSLSSPLENEAAGYQNVKRAVIIPRDEQDSAATRTQNESRIQGGPDVDCWLRDFDFDAHCPFDALEFIMSGRETMGWDLSNLL